MNAKTASNCRYGGCRVRLDSKALPNIDAEQVQQYGEALRPLQHASQGTFLGRLMPEW